MHNIVHNTFNVWYLSILLLLELAPILAFNFRSLDVKHAYIRLSSGLKRKVFSNRNLLSLNSVIYYK